MRSKQKRGFVALRLSVNVPVSSKELSEIFFVLGTKILLGRISIDDEIYPGVVLDIRTHFLLNSDEDV